MTKRLTEKQKEEIVESFKSGLDIDALAQKNSCTNLTIIRNLKKNLGELLYNELIKKSKSSKEKSKTNKNKVNDLQEINFDNDDLNNNINDLKVLNVNIAVLTQQLYEILKKILENLNIRILSTKVNP